MQQDCHLLDHYFKVRKKNTTGWWEGETQQKGKKKEVGWFPATYVKSLSGGPAGATSGASSARSTPDTKATVPPSAAVAADDGTSHVSFCVVSVILTCRCP